MSDSKNKPTYANSLFDDDLFPSIVIADNSYVVSEPLDFDDFVTDFDINQELHEWIDYMPPLSKIKEMCEEYPALKSSFEKFKSIYLLVEKDYNGQNNDS